MSTASYYELTIFFGRPRNPLDIGSKIFIKRLYSRIQNIQSDRMRRESQPRIINFDNSVHIPPSYAVEVLELNPEDRVIFAIDRHTENVVLIKSTSNNRILDMYMDMQEQNVEYRRSMRGNYGIEHIVKTPQLFMNKLEVSQGDSVIFRQEIRNHRLVIRKILLPSISSLSMNPDPKGTPERTETELLPPTPSNESNRELPILYPAIRQSQRIQNGYEHCSFSPLERKITDNRFYQELGHLPYTGNPKYDDYLKLLNKIYNCTEPCKMCPQNMLLGRGYLFADIMFISHAPKPELNGHLNREVCGDYHIIGQRANQLISSIRNRNSPLTFWLTNSVKCSCPNWSERFSVCKKWLEREIAIIAPKLLILFGEESQRNLNVYAGILKDYHGTIDWDSYHNSIDLKSYPCIRSFHLGSRPKNFKWSQEQIETLADKIVDTMEEIE